MGAYLIIIDFEFAELLQDLKNSLSNHSMFGLLRQFHPSKTNQEDRGQNRKF